MFGFSLKIWNSQFEKESDEFKTLDSVVYIFNEIDGKDIIHLSTVINFLVGDESLQEIFRNRVGYGIFFLFVWGDPCPLSVVPGKNKTVELSPDQCHFDILGNKKNVYSDVTRSSI